MKHLRILSAHRPAKAAYWQEVVCSMAVMINAIMGFTGGSIPFVLYIEEKCDIPVPNDGGGESTS